MIRRSLASVLRRVLSSQRISSPCLTRSIFRLQTPQQFPEVGCFQTTRYFGGKSKAPAGKGDKEKKEKVEVKKKESVSKEKKASKKTQETSKTKEKRESKSKQKVLLYSSEEEDSKPIQMPDISILDLQESKTEARHKSIKKKIEEIKEKPKIEETQKIIEEKITLRSLKSKIAECKKTGDLMIKIKDYVDVRIPKKNVEALHRLREMLQKAGIKYLTAFCDGGWKSRKDVGAIGTCLVIHDSESRQNFPLLSLGIKLHNTTNNQCEHLAIIFALILFEQLGLQKCSILSDSDLAICQINGTMKIYNAALKEIVAVTHVLVQDFNEVDFTFIRREYNQLADALVKLQFEATVPVHFTLSNVGVSYLEELL